MSVCFLPLAVRYGRVPKRSREREGVENTRGVCDSGGIVVGMTDTSQVVSRGGEMENKHLAIYDIILTISQAHHYNCGYTEDKIRSLVRKPISFVSI